MSTPHIDPDRLADSALGNAALSDAESAHMAGCPECRFEQELVSAAGRLGGVEVATLSPTRVADVVRHRLAGEPPARRGPSRATWLVGLAAAAALTLAVWYGSTRGSAPSGPTAAPVELSVLHELDDLAEPELEAVLESIPLAAGAVFHPEPATLEELNVNDLERLLRSMEE